MNKIILIGNLTADPITRQTNGTNPMNVCNFTIAVNGRRNGQPVAQYFNVAAWGPNAENCQRYLNKGSKVYVEGPLSARTYQANDGTTRIALEVSAQYTEFLTSSPRDDQQPARPNQPAAQPTQPAPQPNYGVNVPVDHNAGFTPVETDELPF